jgi:hypothetical protein
MMDDFPKMFIKGNRGSIYAHDCILYKKNKSNGNWLNYDGCDSFKCIYSINYNKELFDFNFETSCHTYTRVIFDNDMMKIINDQNLALLNLGNTNILKKLIATCVMMDNVTWM